MPRNRFASLFDAGKVLVSLPATGNLVVFEPTCEKYAELASNKVADMEVYASPVLSGKHIYVRERELLTCWTLKKGVTGNTRD